MTIFSKIMKLFLFLVLLLLFSTPSVSAWSWSQSCGNWTAWTNDWEINTDTAQQRQKRSKTCSYYFSWCGCAQGPCGCAQGPQPSGKTSWDYRNIDVKINWGWGNWTTWKNIDAKNQLTWVQKQVRTRLCNNPSPANWWAACLGTDTHYKNLYLPIDGGWSDWSNWVKDTSWSEKRTRTCTSPKPLNSWKYCIWDSTERRLLGSSSSAAYDQNISAWIYNIDYQIEWCPAHITQGGCKVWKFTNLSGTAFLSKNGLTTNQINQLSNKLQFKIEWEGILKIKIVSNDNADNVSIKTYVYQLDKTAPLFKSLAFNDNNSPYIDTTEKYTNTLNNTVLQIPQYKNNAAPIISDYINDNPSGTIITDSNATKVRYKVTDANRRDLKINFSANDEWDWKLKNNSQIKKIELTGSNFNKVITNISTGFSFDTIDFKNVANQWKIISAKIYDNAGNYSEKKFQVYRDESAPDKNKFIFTHNDKNTNLNYSNRESKFIPANDQFELFHSWGTGNENNHIGDIEMLVEDINKAPMYQKSTLLGSTIGTALSHKFDLSKVDNEPETSGSSKNYRKYSIQFKSPNISGNKICDNVGNCIPWEDVLSNFRVMAHKIDTLKSSMVVSATESNNKVFANNNDGYQFTYTLKDKYNNKVANVQSANGAIIKNVSSTLPVTNGLNGKQVNIAWATYTNNAISINWTEVINNSNNTNKNIILKEANNSADGIYSFTIKSKVPTVSAYKYMKDSSVFSINKITTSVNYNSATYNQPADGYSSGIKNMNHIWLVDSNAIIEDLGNRHNWTVAANYGKITNSSLNLNKIEGKYNLHFASPIVYTTDNLNLLRDGIDSKHSKTISKYWVNGNYSLHEKYFDFDAKNSISWKTNFYVNNNKQNDFVTYTNPIDINKEYKARYEAKSGSNFSKWGYISYLKVNGVAIPSISRWIKANISPVNKAQDLASANFPDVIHADSSTVFLTKDLSINGVIRKWDWVHSDFLNQKGLISLELDKTLSRSEMLKQIKKNIFNINKNSNWYTVNSGEVFNIESLQSQSNLNNFKYTINGETIYFLEGNVDIKCIWSNWCNTNSNDKITIIVKDGRLNIKSNITWDGKIFLVSISDAGQSNINLKNDKNNVSKQKGWITVDQNVTNINSLILAQWAFVSSNNSEIIHSYDNEYNLLNQLHIKGSVLSLNTIWGSKSSTCPYIETNCTEAISKVYDLSFLRRYTLVKPNDFGWTWTNLVPYHPNIKIGQTSKSSIYKSDLEAQGKDSAPVVIEKDTRWSVEPSIIMQDNK